MADLTTRRQAGPTPYRVTTVTLDNNETSLAEPGGAWTRQFGDLHPVYPTTTGVEQLASGVWILSPVNGSFNKAIENVSTGEPAAFGTMRLSGFNAASNVEEIPYWRTPSELSGIGTAASVSAQSDFWMKKRVPATGSFNNAIPITMNPLVVPSDWPMDRILEQDGLFANLFPAEQGYLLRFVIDSRKEEHIDTLFVFYFGGEVLPDGTGQFALRVNGDGTASLWETGSDGGWHYRDNWRWCNQLDVPVSEHSLRILPHARKWIEFKHEETVVLGGANSMLATGAPSRTRFETSAHLYTIQVPGHRADYSQFVTNPGICRMDVARFLKMRFQINTLLYPVGIDNQGTLLDGPFDAGYNLSTSHLYLVTLNGYNWLDGDVQKTFIPYQVVNSLDGSTLVQTTETYTDVGGASKTDTGFVPVGAGLNPVNVRIHLYTNDSGHTPYFFGYTVRRNPTRATVSPGSETLSGTETLREVSIMGPDADPTHESASLAVIDHTGKIAKLAQHADTPIVVQVGYDKSDLTKHFNAFRGYVLQADRVKKHVRSAGAFHNFCGYDVSAVGMWRRIAETRLREIPNEAKGWSNDPNAPQIDGQPQAYTYAYILQWMLRYCGFDDDEIQVDQGFSDLRPVPLSDKDTWLVMPMAQTSVAEYVDYVLSAHVGGYLLWDNNAGPANQGGAWRLRMFPAYTDTPVFHWLTNPGISGKVIHRLESYAANTAYMLRKGYRDWPVPPEGNLLNVACPVQAGDPSGLSLLSFWIVNDKSVSLDPGTPTADPTDLDYLGRAKRLLWWDAYPHSPAKLLNIGYRVAEVAMRGFRMRTWTGPLVLISPTGTNQSGSSVYAAGVKRPLQFGDVVTVDGATYMIRSVSPAWRHDTIQMAKYEAQQLRAPIWGSVCPAKSATHSLGSARRAQQLFATRQSGLLPWSPQLFQSHKALGYLADPALNLPLLSGAISDPRSAGGTHVFMVDSSPIDGSAPIQ